ncbi:hypothetical protein BKA62DRAFT_718643 [Auriculariales sp. MPI-PUGE-AT-0066]|nr:hypothetical protein BKA62DRAFT_718643 [Auriculariales sp. MPI-PUGE-AT-0066]
MSHENDLVTVRAGDTEFEVSRRLLASVSETLEVMLNSSTYEAIQLQVSANRFRDFLWFLQANPMQFQQYANRVPETIRFQRSISIAAVAATYQANAIAEWAIQQIMEMLPRRSVDPELLTWLYHLARHYPDITLPAEGRWFSRTVTSKWCSQLVEASDPVPWLIAARNVQDTALRAQAYYFILQRRMAGQIAGDDRLSRLDRIRLSVGALNLRRHQRGTITYTPYDGDARNWQPRVECLPTHVRNEYDGVSLWDIFTRSPLGIDDQRGSQAED